MGTDIRLTIHNAIEKNKASYFAFLKDLISFDSRILEAGKYGQEKGIQDYLKQYFQKLGAQVDAFSPENEKICKYAGFNKNHTYENRENVVAIFKGAGGGRSLLMNGHSESYKPVSEYGGALDNGKMAPSSGFFSETDQADVFFWKQAPGLQSDRLHLQQSIFAVYWKSLQFQQSGIF